MVFHMPPTNTAANRTALHTALDVILKQSQGRTLGEYVAEQRSRSIGWDRLATNLYTLTGVAVHGSTLSEWFPEVKS